MSETPPPASNRPYSLSAIGYSLKEGFGNQSDSTKFGIFMADFLLPGVTGAFSIIPKLMYRLDGVEKEIMYQELMERRYSMERLKSYNKPKGEEVPAPPGE